MRLVRIVLDGPCLQSVEEGRSGESIVTPLKQPHISESTFCTTFVRSSVRFGVFSHFSGDERLI